MTIIVHNVEGLNLDYPVQIDSFQTHSELISDLTDDNPNALVEYQFGDAYMYATVGAIDALNQGDIYVQPVEDYYVDTGYIGMPDNNFLVDFGGGLIVGI